MPGRLGGCGIWWVLDIIRIGSAPVYAHEYRLAADLPHWAFVRAQPSVRRERRRNACGDTEFFRLT